ncbi:MAG TPA: hypothetical protein VGM25_06060 [Caulobacteraceae bacterium]
MGLFSDRRIILAGGGAAALLLGLGVAGLFVMRAPKASGPPPASKGGLVVEQSSDNAPVDPGRPLRCFVGGQMVGEMTLAECAKKNGVASRALDLGVDATGGLAAASDNGPVVQPLTPQQALQTPTQGPPAAPPGVAPTAAGAGQPVAPCWRRDADWRRLPTDLTLNACVQALYAGRCVKAGEVAYGRWGEETLRLYQRRIEASADNRTFRPLVEQGPNCSTPPIPG